MANIDDYEEGELVRMLFVGDSGVGKTGALLFLAEAGYELKILDFDGNASILKRGSKATRDAGRIQVHRCKDITSRETSSLNLKIKSRGIRTMNKALINWNFDDKDKPALSLDDMGKNHILVIDSFSAMCRQVMNYVKAEDGKLNGRTEQQHYLAAREMLDSLIDIISDSGCHLIVITHLTTVEDENDVTRYFPSSITKAHSAMIPRYFPMVLHLELNHVAGKVKRLIHTKPTARVGVKCPLTDLAPKLPHSGLVEIFEKTMTEGLISEAEVEAQAESSEDAK